MGKRKRQLGSAEGPLEASWHSVVEAGGLEAYVAQLRSWLAECEGAEPGSCAAVAEGAAQQQQQQQQQQKQHKQQKPQQQQQQQRARPRWRKRATCLVVALARVLALGRDAQWAGVVPHGLRGAAGKDGQTAKGLPLLRDDREGRAALDELLTAALTLTLSHARCSELCAVLVGPAPEGCERVAIGEVMGKILPMKAKQSGAASKRADACGALVAEFARFASPDVQLLLRLLALRAHVIAEDASGVATWARAIPRDRVPPPLLAATEKLLRAKWPAGDAQWNSGVGGAGSALAPLSLGPLPSRLTEAAQVASDGWGSKRGHKSKGRHGAVLVGTAAADDDAGAAEAQVLATGVNAAEGEGARGGFAGKFVVHAEMAALREALSKGGGRAAMGATVYVARLAPEGECFETGAPCENCTAVLRAVGVSRAIWTTEAGAVAEEAYAMPPEAPELSDEHKAWAGIR